MTTPRPISKGRQSITRPALPLELQPYHVVYLMALSAIVIGGTLYSVAHSTHLYNVSLNASTTQPITDPIKQAISSSSPTNQMLAESAKLPATIFADRRNWINRFFVKKAWAWTTFAFIAQALTLRAAPMSSAERNGGPSFDVGPSSSSSKERKRDDDDATATMEKSEATIYSPLSRSTFRYLVATLLWVFFAAWFFGPPLMTRILHWSGAVCLPLAPVTESGSTIPGKVHPSFCYLRTPLTPENSPELFQTKHSTLASMTNGSLSARWQGGHDISGHTYILILSTIYLLEEIIPYLPYLFPISFYPYLLQIIPRNRWSTHHPFLVATAGSHLKARANKLVLLTILSLVGIWIWCLLCTALFFHTPQEKASGLLAGLLASLLIPKGG